MPTFIKPGYWNNKRKQLAGELNLDLLIQQSLPSTTTTSSTSTTSTTTTATPAAYKVCSVLLTGNVDNSLTVVELENTIGFISWALLFGVSLQMQTGNNNFTTGKTAVFFSNNPTGKSLSATVYTNQNNIAVGVSDGYTTFNNTFVEIRVYN